MYNIQNSVIGRPTFFNKTVAGLGLVATISAIALSLIKFSGIPLGPLSAIVQFGATTNGILLGTSTFLFVLDLLWLVVLCKKQKELPTSQPESTPTQFPSPSNPLQDTSRNENNVDFVTILPQEVSQCIFAKLDPITLGRSCLVSKNWHTLASDSVLWKAFNLRTISPLLTVFDKSNWVTHVDLSAYGLSIGDEPPLDHRKVIPFLLKNIPYQEIEGNAGVTLLTIPKGLTLNKLVTFAQSPKVGKGSTVSFVTNRIPNSLGNIAIKQTYRILITNNVFNGSRYKAATERKKFMSTIGGKMPKVLELTTLIVTTFMHSGKCLYNHNPLTYSFCSEKISGRQAIAGGFIPKEKGFVVSSTSPCLSYNFGIGGRFDLETAFNIPENNNMSNTESLVPLT